MEWTIKCTGAFKKIVMHVKEMCRHVIVEYSPRMFTIKAVAMFNQSYTETCMPPSFFANVRGTGRGSINIDITHLYRVLKSCACTDKIVMRIERSSVTDKPDSTFTVVFLRDIRRQTFVITCRPNDRDISLRSLDSTTTTTVSSNMLLHAFERVYDLVDDVELKLDYCADKDVLHVSGRGDVADIVCTIPTRIVCGDISPHAIGKYDLPTLYHAAYFSSMSSTGDTQLHCSARFPLKLFFKIHECYVTIMIASKSSSSK